MKTAVDLSIGAVGFLTAEAYNGLSGSITAGAAAIYLICKGIVLVIREVRRKQIYRVEKPKIKAE